MRPGHGVGGAEWGKTEKIGKIKAVEVSAPAGIAAVVGVAASIVAAGAGGESGAPCSVSIAMVRAGTIGPVTAVVMALRTSVPVGGRIPRICTFASLLRPELFGVLEQVVGFIDFVHLFRGVGVVGMKVGVVLLGLLPVCFFYFVLRCVPQ